ncbi:Tetratricopeptide TPR_4 [Catenulispora acidiphila DSM 44928]|uniref:Tetratricopeptide TPR_4 n=1 Tax=Catenulispora acidiphila (strain DSM 44928 / JCM 14897 / NBRC 102108 / NRRL B-24433 / ID139908) TaxID=479433 RepID=C7QDG8_CATAD|nr:CHAT domain-containing protein [Catenulispora acidiphila]ACU72761.1 Tetratricopeptide TPR_4 [Catenulispora acidiphila DSM 44928]
MDMGAGLGDSHSAVLQIDGGLVRFKAGAGSVAQEHSGLTYRAREALRELRELRQGTDAVWWELGLGLGESFLDGPVGVALAAELGRAAQTEVPLRLALDIAEPALVNVPWEAMVLPERCDRSRRQIPLAHDSAVQVFRLVEQESATGTAVRATPGVVGRTAGGVAGGPARLPRDAGSNGAPLEVLVAIAFPERSGLDRLDYERELVLVQRAMRPAIETGMVSLRLLTWGTADSIGAALRERPADILHISCHAAPGVLALETVDGEEDFVDAGTLVSRVFPQDRPVPMVVLAGCSSALGTVDDVQGPLPGLAHALVARGVDAVVAMTADISDDCAVEFTAGLYATLAQDPTLAPLDVVTQTRAALAPLPPREPGMTEPQQEPARERGREQADRNGREARTTLIPALFLNSAGVGLRNVQAGSASVPGAASEPGLGSGVGFGAGLRASSRSEVLGGWNEGSGFVGRRTELRGLLRILRSDLPRVILFGMTGIGKSALAAELITLLDPGAWVVVPLDAGAAADSVVSTLLGVLNRVGALGNPMLESWLSDPDTPWIRRLDLVSENVLPHTRVLLMVDGVSCSGDPATGAYAAEPAELGWFLDAWSRLGPNAGLLVTCRHPISFETRGRKLVQHCLLGPLSASDTQTFLYQHAPQRSALFAKLPDAGLLGGHPAALGLVANAVRNAQDPTALSPEVIHHALNETAPALDEVFELFAGLDAGHPVRQLLVGASVYRGPVRREALEQQLALTDQAATNPERTTRLTVALENVLREAQTEDVSELWWEDGEPLQFSETLLADLEDAQRPVVDPSFPEVLRSALGTGLIFGSYDNRSGVENQNGADDGNEANREPFKVHPWVAAQISALADQAEVDAARRRAASYWRRRLNMDLARGHLPSLSEDAERLLEQFDALGDMAAAKEPLLRSVSLAYLRGTGGYEQLRERCELGLAHLPLEPKETVVLLLLHSVACYAMGDEATGACSSERAVEAARSLPMNSPTRVQTVIMHTRNLLRLPQRAGEVATLIDEAAEGARACGYDLLDGAVDHLRAMLAVRRQQFDECDQFARAALHTVAGVAPIWYTRAVQWEDVVDLSEALRLGELAGAASDQAILAEGLGIAADTAELGCLGLCAAIALERGRLDEAAAFMDRARQVADRTPLPGQLPPIYALDSTIALLQGDISRAGELCRAGVTSARAFDDRVSETRCLNLLGQIAMHGGQANTALREFGAAYACGIGTVADDQARVSAVFCAFVYTTMEDPRARDWLDKVGDTLPTDPGANSLAQYMIGQTALVEGDFATATRHAQDMLRVIEEGDYPQISCMGKLLLAQCAAGRDDWDAAGELFSEAIDASEVCDQPLLRFDVLLSGIEMVLTIDEPVSVGDLDALDEMAQEAEAIAQGADAPGLIARVLQARQLIRGRRRGPLGSGFAGPLLRASRDVGDAEAVENAIVAQFHEALNAERFEEASEHLAWLKSVVEAGNEGKRLLLGLMEASLDLEQGRLTEAEERMLQVYAAADAGGPDIAELAAMAAGLLAAMAAETSDLHKAECWQATALRHLITGTAEWYQELDGLKDMAEERAAADPAAWWQNLEAIADDAVARHPALPDLAAAVHQILAKIADDHGPAAQRERWLRQALSLWPTDVPEHSDYGPRATRHALARLLARDEETLDEATSLLIYNLCRSEEDGSGYHDPFDELLLGVLRQYWGEPVFAAKLATQADAEQQARILAATSDWGSASDQM